MRQADRAGSPGCHVRFLIPALARSRLIRRAESLWLGSYPMGESGNFRMGSQRFHRVELALERLLCEQRVDVVVARSTKPCNSLLHFSAVEISFVPLVRMARARDQVMPRQQPHIPIAEFAAVWARHVQNDRRPGLSRKRDAGVGDSALGVTFRQSGRTFRSF